MEKAKKERLWNSPALRRRVSNRVWQNRYIYMMVIPVVIYLLLLRYMPLWFLRSSFYDYKLLRDSAGQVSKRIKGAWRKSQAPVFGEALCSCQPISPYDPKCPLPGRSLPAISI